jgi:hypothetical protein
LLPVSGDEGVVLSAVEVRTRAGRLDSDMPRHAVAADDDWAWVACGRTGTAKVIIRAAAESAWRFFIALSFGFYGFRISLLLGVPMAPSGGCLTTAPAEEQKGRGDAGKTGENLPKILWMLMMQVSAG